MIPLATRLHWPIADPAKATGTSEDRLAVFRSVRDDIARRIDALLKKEKL
jgi:arsenate reductase